MTAKMRVSAVASLFLLFLFLSALYIFPDKKANRAHQDKINIGYVLFTISDESLSYLSTNQFTDFSFQKTLYLLSKQASEDLDIQLSMLPVSATGQLNASVITDYISRNKPEAIIMTGYFAISIKMAELFEMLQIPFFVINAPLRDIGKPRERFKYYIGDFLTEDEDAGYQLARHLIERARRNPSLKRKGKINMVGLTGLFLSEVSNNRLKGLKRAVSESSDVVLSQVFSTNYSAERSMKKFEIIIKSRYPETSVVWCESDSIAAGVIKAARQMGIRPGEELIMGGIDWTESGFEAVKKGEMEVTLGAHLLDGAWSVILLYDYLNGKDFASETTQFRSTLIPADIENIEVLQKTISSTIKKDINFRHFSKTYNRDLKLYDFSIKGLTENIFN